jgi:hypothetical protein
LAGLARAVATTDELTATERADVARIISIADVTERKALLKSYRGGRIYRWLLKAIYPSLRTAEYEIEYTIEIK